MGTPGAEAHAHAIGLPTSSCTARPHVPEQRTVIPRPSNCESTIKSSALVDAPLKCMIIANDHTHLERTIRSHGLSVECCASYAPLMRSGQGAEEHLDELFKQNVVCSSRSCVATMPPHAQQHKRNAHSVIAKESCQDCAPTGTESQRQL